MLKIIQTNIFVAAVAVVIAATPVFSQTAKPATNCQTDTGKDGYEIQNKCYAADITSLNLLGGYGEPSDFSDLGLLKGFSKLRELFVDNTQVSDLSPLGGLAKLDSLKTPDGKKHDTRKKVVAAIKKWSKP